MSLHYTLFTTGNMEPAEFVQALFLPMFGLVEVKRDTNGDEYTEVPGFVAFPFRGRGLTTIHDLYPDLERFFSKSEGASVTLHYSRAIRLEDAETILLKATLSIIHTTPWEVALLLQNNEKIALCYKNDLLVLNSLFDIWTPKRLSMVKIPYVYKEMGIQ